MFLEVPKHAEPLTQGGTTMSTAEVLFPVSRELRPPTKGVIIHCYPGGNDTYLVFNHAASRTQHADINRQIMAAQPCFEQGGFLEAPSTPSSAIRLQMAGNEFCGNAARAAAGLVAMEYLTARRISACRFDRIATDGNILNFRMEVSGIKQEVAACVTVEGSSLHVAISFSVPSSSVSAKSALLGNGEGQKNVPVTIVTLPGISHVVVDDLELSFSPDRATYTERTQSAVHQLGLAELPAVGVITRRGSGNAMEIEPVVWVRDLNTCFYETACGSGSIAAAIADCLLDDSELRVIPVHQPSGTVLTAGGTRTETGTFALELSGPVEIKAELDPQHLSIFDEI